MSKTMLSKIFVIFFLVIALFQAEAFEPYERGPYEVTRISYSSLFNQGLQSNLRVWAPNAPGNFPVLYFLTGLGASIDPLPYYQGMEHMATHGYTVVAPYHYLSSPDSNYAAKWLTEVVSWVKENLASKLVNDGLNGDFGIDFDNSFMAGHSSGAHIAVNYLKQGCFDIKGLILLSPVDGVDPFGFIHDFCITPGEKLPFELPTLMLVAGLDSVPGFNAGDFYPACVPEDLGNMRFWNALNGRGWFNNATKFGHADFLCDVCSDIVDFTHFCAGNTDAEIEIPYKIYPAGQMVSFMNGLLGDCGTFVYLSDTSLMSVEVLAFEQGNETCVTGYCKELNVPNHF